MVALIMIAFQLLADAARFVILLFRPTRSLQAAAICVRDGIKPRNIAGTDLRDLLNGDGANLD
jgi:hypothetical protein